MPFKFSVVAISSVAVVCCWSILCASEPPMPRTWVDATGAYRVEATFAGMDGETVRLRRADGKLLQVQLEKLSPADRQYVEELTAAEPRPEDAFAETAVDSLGPAEADPAPRRAEFLRQKLAALVGDYELVEAPLAEYAQFLGDEVSVPVLTDFRRLEEAGVPPDSPVSCDTAGKTLAECLDEMLAPLELAWIVRNEAIVVTSRAAAEASCELRRYRLLKPAPADAPDGGRAAAMEVVRRLSEIDAAAWEEQGGLGASALLARDTLLVRQSSPLHLRLQSELPELLVPAPLEKVPPSADVPVDAALAAVIHVEFKQTPLRDALLLLEDQTKAPIYLDRVALEEAGVSPDVPLTLAIREVSFAAALGLLLEPLDLRYAQRHDVLLIGTREAAEELLETRVYRVVASPLWQRDGAADPAAVAATVEGIIAPGTWDDVGGTGTVRACLPDLLVVRQTSAVHAEIERWLAEVLSPVPLPVEARRSMAAADALAVPVSPDFVEAPLSEVVEFLNLRSRLPIALDVEALEVAGLDPRMPVTLSLREAKLESVLELLAESHGLAAVIAADGVHLTTPARAERTLETRIHAWPGNPNDLDAAHDLISSVVAPACWAEVGGRGSIRPGKKPGTLEIEQSPIHQRQIDLLLLHLRAALGS